VVFPAAYHPHDAAIDDQHGAGAAGRHAATKAGGRCHGRLNKPDKHFSSLIFKF